MPSLMWRIDKEWKGLRSNTPWVKRPPSDYIRDHIRLTVQPVDAPPAPVYLEQIIDQLESDTILMFATDYPHWDFDAPDRALPPVVKGDLKRRILAANAAAFYGLEG